MPMTDCFLPLGTLDLSTNCLIQIMGNLDLELWQKFPNMLPISYRIPVLS